uniref:SSD domain-containing protein n=1 Tax=Heterorhabditis bacteriophora TaxID=37862 RepID=A0A1I7XIE4_HETBA
MACVPYFTLSVMFVFTFILITNRREHFHVAHSVVMAFLGVIGPLMAVATTFCLLFLLGYPFNSIALVMPFLIIGVGSDDVFIIIHAMRKTDKSKGLEEQIVETFSGNDGGGWSLYHGNIRHQYFILTFFVAALVYEERRVTKDIEKPDIRIPVEVEKKQSVCAQSSIRSVFPADPNGIVAKYCRVIKYWQTRFGLLIILIIYWTASLYGCMQMEVKMDTTNLVMKDSQLQHVAFLYEKYLWSEGQLVMVFVNSPPDLSEERNQHAMFQLVDRFERLPYSMGRNSTSFWLRSYLYQSALYHSKDGFYTLLDQWLKDPENGGARWNDMVRLERNATNAVIGVEKSLIYRFMFATACAMGADASWNTRAYLQHQWRTLANQYSNFNVTVFQAYSFYVDQLDSIGGNTLSTVIVAAITMDLACFLMIPSASSIISSSVAMLSINIGVFGLLSLWNVNLDPITMCTTLMSIGFSVDFTVTTFTEIPYLGQQMKDWLMP